MRLSARGEIISLISRPRRDFFPSTAFFRVADRAEKWRRGRFSARAPRLSDPRGYRRSCRRSQDAEDAEEQRTKGEGEGDNEIEMAKADHRIGWLNGEEGGGGGRRAKQVVQDDDEGANPRGYSTVCESALSCSCSPRN